MAEKYSERGYSNPGPQNISINQVINDLPFLSDLEWEKIRTTGDFDYVVVGSSFCALGFIHQLLKNNPAAKIIILERGDYVTQERIQDLSPLELSSVEKKTETFHWTVSERSLSGEYIESVRGMNNMFGGRSHFWKAWCPQPKRHEMTEWPLEVIDAVQTKFTDAKALLNVQTFDKILAKGNGKLQEIIHKKLESAPETTICVVKENRRIEHAPLAITENKCR